MTTDNILLFQVLYVSTHIVMFINHRYLSYLILHNNGKYMDKVDSIFVTSLLSTIHNNEFTIVSIK